MTGLPYVIVPESLLTQAIYILENSMFEFVGTGERALEIAGELRKAKPPHRMNADAAAMILSEEARIEDSKIANIPYLAVRLTASACPVSLEEIVGVLERSEIALSEISGDRTPRYFPQSSWTIAANALPELRSLLHRLKGEANE